MWAGLLADTLRHALLALGALALACLVGGPFGLLAASRGWARSPILGVAALGRTLPSIAVLALLVPLLGVGIAPAIAALTLLALPPIVINVDLAIRVVVPLALPVALAGVRTASVEVIGSATLATFVGAGGLGDDIVRGLQTGDSRLLLIASAIVAAMALATEIRR
jgi:osmoprotectant transport system permease protein